jgi:hypothetical protein
MTEDNHSQDHDQDQDPSQDPYPDEPTIELRLSLIEDRLAAVAAILRDYLGSVDAYVKQCHRRSDAESDAEARLAALAEGESGDALAWLDARHCD